ncbi:MAG: ATP synthase F1 subunit delta [Patescibacteria group bacterium]|nr:ATP synthase F1 subunit delta [Patescibacteria group bacterium]
MKKNSTKQYAIALWQATRKAKGKDLETVLANFSALLARERVLKKTEAIIAEFIRYAKEQDGVEDLEIISARPLNNKIIGAIKEIFGQKAEATERTDASLIGGVIIRTRDRILDASIKTQLNKLCRRMMVGTPTLRRGN